MRKVLLLILIGFTGTLSAQDIIMLKDGSEITAKIIRVGDNEVEFKKWENQDGPTFAKKTTDVFMIKYANGQKEVFNKETPSQNQNQSQAPIVVVNNNNYNNNNDDDYMKPKQMVRDGNDLILNNHKLSDEEIKLLVGPENFETFQGGCRQRYYGRWAVSVGWILFGAGLVAILLDEPSIYAPILSVSMIGIGGGYTLKGIGSGRIDWVAEEYNKKHFISEVNIKPALMQTSMPTRKNTYALGLNLSIKVTPEYLKH